MKETKRKGKEGGERDNLRVVGGKEGGIEGYNKVSQVA